MCDMKKGGFVHGLFENIGRIIAHDPGKTGRFEFFPMPLFFNDPGESRIVNALGMTVSAIVALFPKAAEKMDAIFDRSDVTPAGVARAIAEISVEALSQAVPSFEVSSPAAFGSARVCFQALDAVLSLFLGNLAGVKQNGQTERLEQSFRKIRRDIENLCLLIQTENVPSWTTH